MQFYEKKSWRFEIPESFYVSSGFDHLGVIILKMKDLCQEKERRDV